MAPLIAAALGMAPALVEALLGQKAGAVADAAVGAIAGTTDPEAIRNLPPEKRAELRVALEQIALQQMQAEYADRANAREMANKSKLIAWAQVIGGACVLLTWAVTHLMLLLMDIPPEKAATITLAVSGISTAFGAVMQFFFGSSTSSHAANQRSDRLAEKATEMLPAPTILAPDPARSADDLNARSLAAARGNR